MKVKALSYYNGDKNTRFGDCILGFGENKLLVYDGGHERHADEVKEFLEEHTEISDVSIIVSHDDSDHSSGVVKLMEYLDEGKWTVKLYTHLYLKNVDEIHEMLDDGRRKKNKTCEHILEIFENIANIVMKAEELGYTVESALPDTDVGLGQVVGPTKEEFIPVVTRAIEEVGQGTIDGETVMNAASIQVKCTLESGSTILLCGDATPEYIHDIESYDIIQLPHHGQLDDAEMIFDSLEDPYCKEFLISDNTGSGYNSGGSDKLVKKMKQEKFTPAYNTKEGVVELPKEKKSSGFVNNTAGVRLGDLDC